MRLMKILLTLAAVLMLAFSMGCGPQHEPAGAPGGYEQPDPEGYEAPERGEPGQEPGQEPGAEPGAEPGQEPTF